MRCFPEIIDELNQSSEKSIRLGLNNMMTLVETIDLSLEQSLIIHIAGTNGKGSTGYYLYQLFKQSFDRVSLYLSPHLKCVTERFLMSSCGKETSMPQKEFVVLYEDLLQRLKGLSMELSYFEMITTIALMWVARNNISVSIWEVGLGGRLDATNVLPANMSVITNIGFDHQEYLGETLEAILYEKAGIVKRDQIVVSGIQDVALREKLQWIVQEKEATVFFVDFDEKMNFMEQNYALAQTVFQKYCSIQEGRETECFDSRLPGRMEWIRPNMCLDGAHNVHAMKALVQELKNMTVPLTVILGITQGKDFSAMLDVLSPHIDRLFFLEKVYDHQMNPHRLLEVSSVKKLNPTIVKLDDLKNCIDLDNGGTTILTGSLYCLEHLRQVFA